MKNKQKEWKSPLLSCRLILQICSQKTSRRQTQSRSQQKSTQRRPHTKNPCPARGKMCNKCGKKHFAKMCFTGQRTTPAGQSRRAPNHRAHTVSVDIVQGEQESNISDDEYRILPKVSPALSAVDMPQTGEGAHYRICTTHLEYKPPPSLLSSSSYRMEFTLVLSSNTAAR